jgi:hypothetical protein
MCVYLSAKCLMMYCSTLHVASTLVLCREGRELAEGMKRMQVYRTRYLYSHGKAKIFNTRFDKNKHLLLSLRSF